MAPARYSPLTIASIRQSSTNDSIIWAGTGAGLMEVNKYTHAVQFYVCPRVSNGLFLFDRKKEDWIFSRFNGEGQDGGAESTFRFFGFGSLSNGEYVFSGDLGGNWQLVVAES